MLSRWAGLPTVLLARPGRHPTRGMTHTARSPPKLRAVAVDASELLRRDDQQAAEKVLHNVTCHAFDCQRAYGWMATDEDRSGRQMMRGGTVTGAFHSRDLLLHQPAAGTAARGVDSK